MPSRPIQFLLVGAHPADSFDQAGGTLAHHAARGDKVTVAIATTGVRSHHSILLEAKRAGRDPGDVEKQVKEATEQKLQEARAACRILGYDDVRTLGYEDDDVLVTQEKIEAIADVIREVKPDVIITHHPFEGGGLKMHGTIGQATIHAWQVAYGLGRGGQQPHKASVLYFMSSINHYGFSTLDYAGTARAELYIDITDVIDKKVRAYDQIYSQFFGGSYSRKTVETEDARYGQAAGCAYAECFQRYRPMVRYTLPITDFDLNAVTESHEVVRRRRTEMTGAFMPMPPGKGFETGLRVPAAMYDK